MKDQNKTKAKLIAELDELRQRVSELEQFESENKLVDEKLRIIFDYAPDAYYISDLKGKFVDGNKAAERITGYRKEELIGKSFLKLNILPKNQIPKAAVLVARNALGESTGPDEFTLIRKDGNKIEVEISTHPVKTVGETLVLGIARDITERKKAQDELRESEEKYRGLMEQSLQGLIIAQNNPVRISFASKPMQDITGFSPELLESFGPQELTRLIHPDDRDRFFGNFRNHLRGKNVVQRQEYKLIHKSGDIRWVEILSSLIEYDGSPATQTAFYDITERARAEESLRESEAHYRQLFNLLPYGGEVIDTAGKIIDCSLNTLRMLGYEKDEFVGKYITNFVDADSAKLFKQNFPKLLKGKSLFLEGVMVHKDGSRINILRAAQPIINADKEVEGMLALNIDITERKRAEERIQHLNLVLRAIRNVNQLIVKEKDRGRLLQQTCESLIETRGYFNVWIALLDEDGGLEASAQAGLGEDFSPLVEQFERGELTDCGRRALAQAGVEAIEDPLSACSDCPLAASYSGRGAMTIRLERAGKVYGLLSASIPSGLVADEEEQSLLHEVAGDIALALHNIELEHEQAQAEEALLEEKDKAQKYLDIAGVMFISLNSKGEVTLINRKGSKIVGYKPDEIIGKNWFDTVLPVHIKEETRLVYDSLMTGEIGLGEYNENPIVTKDGEERMIAWHNTILNGDDGSIVGTLSSGEDITERVRAQEEKRAMEAHLSQQQKLESIGTLASGVAHEINNPITGIMNYAQLIYDRINPAEGQLREFSAGIIEESKRVAEIVRNLLTFSRHEKQSHSPARMTDIINNTLSLVRTVIRHDQITLDVDIPDDLPEINCRSQQIQQVVMNLLTNARDALNERYPEYDPDKIITLTVRPFEKEGLRWLRTTVEDHGGGIPEEIRERIFDPFFTTKDKALGTGLGLSISIGIVQDHHGKLTFESIEGQFTRFYLDLPVDNSWEL